MKHIRPAATLMSRKTPAFTNARKDQTKKILGQCTYVVSRMVGISIIFTFSIKKQKTPSPAHFLFYRPAKLEEIQ